MVNYCILCSSTSASSFHRFPKDKDKRSKWLQAINRKDVARCAQLCSSHFEPSDFQETIYGLRSSLKKTAIPRISLQETNCDASNKAASSKEEFPTLIQQNTSKEQSDKTEIEECSTECNDPAKDCCTDFQNTSKEQSDKTEIEECSTECNDLAKDCCTHFQDTSKEQSDKSEIECSTECNDSAKDNHYSLKRKSMDDEIDIPLKHIKHVEDINIYEVSKNEEEAEMVLELAIETIIEQKKKIRRWQKYAYKLKKRVQSLTELTKHLLDNNSISNKV